MSDWKKRAKPVDTDTTAKGSWKDRAKKLEETPSVAETETPSFLEETWDKVTSIPGNLVEAGKDAARLGVRVATGRTEEGEITDRAGAALRGALDVALTPGFAVGQAMGGNEVDPRKPTQQIAALFDQDTANEYESTDKRYPGARAAGQMVPAITIPSASVPGMIASGAAYGAATQASDKGKIDGRELASDTIAGLAPIGAAKIAGKVVEKVGKGGKALAEKYGNSITEKYPEAEQFMDNPALLKEAATADKTAMDLSDAKTNQLQSTKDRYEGQRLENKAHVADIDRQLDNTKNLEKTTKDKIKQRYDGLQIDEKAQLDKLDNRIDDIKARKREGDFVREEELDKLAATQEKLDADIANKATSGLDNMRANTNSAYKDLKGAIETTNIIAPELQGRLNQRVTQILEKINRDGKITGSDKGILFKKLEEVLKQNKDPVSQSLEISKAVREYTNALNPMDSIGRESAYNLKLASDGLTSEISDIMGQTSPDLVALETGARSTARNEIGTREFLKNKIASSMSKKEKVMDSSKVGNRLENGGEIEKQRLRDALNKVGAKRELNARDKVTSRMEQLKVEEKLQKRWTSKGVVDMEKNKALSQTDFDPQMNSELADVEKKYNPVRERLMSRKEQIEYPELPGQLQSELRDIADSYDPRIQSTRDLGQDYKNLQQSEGYVKQIAGASMGGATGLALGGGFGAAIGAEAGRRIGKNLSTGVGQIKLYNALSRAFDKPALTSAVNALTRTGNALSLATIATLAAQHKVEAPKLTKFLMDNGVQVVVDE